MVLKSAKFVHNDDLRTLEFDAVERNFKYVEEVLASGAKYCGKLSRNRLNL